MSRQIKHLFSLLAVVTASITLAGCFRSTDPAIQKGEQMPWGDRAICTVDNTRYVADLSKPEKTENGGVVYNTSSDQYVFKRLEDDLYIVQVKGSNGHIYGYLLNHKTKGIQTLGFPREPGAGLRNLARESDVMLSPSKAAEGWTEMDARKPADIEKFLSRVKIGDLQPKGSCKFSRAPAKDALMAGPLKRNLTRDDALDLSGAYECNLADVCFNLGEGAFPGTLNKGKGTVTAAFTEHGIRKVTISAKGSISDINKILMTPMPRIGISDHVAGPELPGLIARMNAQDPHLLIEIRIGSSGDLLQGFDRREFDAVLVRLHAGRDDGEVLAEEKFRWFAATNWQYRAGEPLPVATMPEPCGVRVLSGKLLDDAGIPWQEIFVGGGVATVSAAVMAGLGVAALAPRMLPFGAVDVGPRLGLPELPRLPVILHTHIRDGRRHDALTALSAAFRAGVRCSG